MKYYLYSRKNEGLLFDKEQLRHLHLEKDELVKAENSDFWVEAEKVDELADLFSSTPNHPETDFSNEPDGADSSAAGAEEYTASNETEDVEAAVDDGASAGVEVSTLPATAAPSPSEPVAVQLNRRRLAVFAAVLVATVLLSTNPRKSSHYEVVQQMVAQGLQTQHESRSWGGSIMDMLFGGFGFFDGMAYNRVLEDVECHNAYFFSYSKLTDEEVGSHWLTLGVLGHVLTLNQDALNEHITNVLYGTHRHKPEKRQTPRKKEPQTLPEGGQSL